LAFSQHLLIAVTRVRVKANEENSFEGRVLFQKGPGFPDGNTRSALQGESIDPGADGGKRHGADAILDSQIERPLVATGQQFILTVVAATPHRSYGVDNPPRREPIAARNLSIARGAAVQRAAFRQKFGPGRSMNRAVHASATQQRGVSRVHNGVDFLLRDVALDNHDGLVWHFAPKRKSLPQSFLDQALSEQKASGAVGLRPSTRASDPDPAVDINVILQQARCWREQGAMRRR